MENSDKERFLKIAHLPTLGLLTGYLIYWLELYFFNKAGKTSVLAAFLFILIAAIVIIKERISFRALYNQFKLMWGKENKLTRYYILVSAIVIAGIVLLVLYASLLPVHLSQEFDALNYHISIPRQHLILKSFNHIEWSSADLFLSPLDFALAPFWLVTELPNKFPQFLFLIGLSLVSASLVKRFSRNNFLSVWLVITAIFGTHFIGIQMGTAMLDIVICYLFLAALDSFLGGAIILSAVEFTFFLWAKPFIPPQVFLISAVMLLSLLFLKKLGFKSMQFGFKGVIDPSSKRGYIRNLKKMIFPIIVFSIIIAGPFLIKSTYYSGTPLFPFAAGALNLNKHIDKSSDAWNSILASSKTHMTAKDVYGYGKSPLDFIRHFWLIAVPERGVNNKYDYPVGLMYLLFLGPFLWMFINSLKKKQFPVLPVFIIAYWLLWWFGSQQTRFLYIPVVLMMIIVSSQIEIQSRIFMSTALFALIITAISILGAHKRDLGLFRKDCLRGKDKEISRMNKLYLESGRKDIIYLDYYDIAYARFPVIVKNVDSAWVLYTNK